MKLKLAALCRGIAGFALTAAAAGQESEQQESASEWKQWSCDELTPDLCDLEVETGSHVIRSIPVKYWRYKRRIVSTLDDGNTNKPLSYPIIMIHGGPSWPHSYMLPLKQLACRGTSEVIFYDQAGCGESTLKEGESVSPSEYPHLLDPTYYSEEELPALIDHWGLDKYHILGSSWGTMLTQLFALNAKDTNGLQSLVLSGPLSDSQSYIAAQWDEKEGNLASLPPFVRDRIHALQEANAYDSAEYEAIDDVLATFFTLRTAPAPDCFTQSADGLNKDVYVGMQGPSEFAMRGVLGDFNVTGRLHEIDVPVLLTHGAYDTMRPSTVKKMEQELKIAERVLLPHSGHVSMIDDAGMMNDVVADFLWRVENTAVGDSATQLEKEKITIWPAWVATSIKVFVAFAAGIAIGRLGGNMNNQGYTSV